jgi:Ca-activated chloride channel family protein
MGVGTKVGAPIRDAQGVIIKQNGIAVISHLEQDKLQEIGHYLSANYTENDSKMVLNQLKARVQAEKNKQQTTRHWEERFYLLILPLMLVMLLGFRKGYVLLYYCPVQR